MTAFLLLDDDAQSYTNAEVYFLRRLCAALPAGVVVRSTHDVGTSDTNPNGSALVVALDLRIAENLRVSPDFTKDHDPQQVALVRRSVQRLAEDARRKLAQFFAAIPKPGNHDCPKCGVAMKAFYTHSKQNLGRPSGYTCDHCGDSKENKELGELVAHALYEHGGPHNRRRV